ncbi:C40 family peptidase [Streptomyces sp. CC210A]|uniref:C40 family peptidase n=1 Tax=Streptomyces sp. CC210A TaxID=2898184 RepID=UPI001F3D6708|nr:C40 family peptidase [Streptomyces sp. CC210A]
MTAEHAARAAEAARQALEAEASDPAQSARALPQAQEARPPFSAPEPAPITAHDAPALPHVPESLERPHTAGAQGLLRAEEPAAHRAQTPALAQATQPHLRDQAFPYARETPALSLMHDIRTPLQAGEQTTPQGAPAPLQAQEPSPAHQAQAPLTAQEPPPAQEAFASRVGPEPDQAQEGHAPCWSPERLPVCEQVWGPQTATAWAPLPREASPVTGAGAAPESGGDGGGRAADADAGHAAKADKVLAFARAQIGKPCVRGATGPSSYDCAGLTQAAWRAAGVDLPRGADAQAESGRRVSAAELLPGDLVFFSEDGGRVGVYAGGGMVIHALAPGAAVREEPLSALPLHGAVRPA